MRCDGRSRSKGEHYCEVRLISLLVLNDKDKVTCEPGQRWCYFSHSSHANRAPFEWPSEAERPFEFLLLVFFLFFFLFFLFFVLPFLSLPLISFPLLLPPPNYNFRSMDDLKLDRETIGYDKSNSYAIIVGLTFMVIFRFIGYLATKAPKVSVMGKAGFCVVVLGDIGHSPRMLLHARSALNAGYKVDVIGYKGTSQVSKSTLICAYFLFLHPLGGQ